MFPTQAPDSPVRLTATQEGMWFAERLNPGRSGYHDAVTLQLTGPLDSGVLREAFADCWRQHDALRLRINEATGRLTQTFDAPAPAWRENDLRALTQDRRAAFSRRRFALDCTEPFDLSGGPLWRIRLLRLADDDYQLLIVLHHLMTDGWSHGVIVRSLSASYATRLRDPSVPPAPAPSFRRWVLRRVAAENSPAAANLARDAAAALRSAPRRIDMPGLTGVRDARGRVVSLDLSPDDMTAFTVACGSSGVSRFMGMTGLFAYLIGDVSGTPELVISAPVADRASPDTADMIGCMISTVPMRVVKSPTALREAALAGRDAVVSALRLVNVPYREIVRASEAPFDTSLSDPLTNFSCEEFNSPRGTWRVGDLTVLIRPRGEFQVRHDLALSIPLAATDPPELIYPAHRWEPGAVDDLAAQLSRLVRSFGREAAASTEVAPT